MGISGTVLLRWTIILGLLLLVSLQTQLLICRKCLTLFGLGGGAKCPPLRVFAKYLKNGSANLHETL